MKICLVGKFPPIQGGVSMHTYRYAHALAARGHKVDVITNAREVKPPYRVFMREDDWRRCEAKYRRGFVRVHWTEPADGRQFHIPMSSAFVTKLASLGIAASRAAGFDVVFSYYAEPYAIAGHLIADAVGVPHVIRTAGSDAGRLWQQPQIGPLYDHVFRSADALVVGGIVAKRLQAIGVTPERIHRDPQSPLPAGEFGATGPALDFSALRRAAEESDFVPLFWGEWRAGIRYVGVYGKLGETKGTYALLRALARVIGQGRDVGVLIMGHARPRSGRDVRTYASELGLARNVVQVPFLPHWRVPEFIRRCVAICCLEQDFPVSIHRPIVAEEVLAAGACLIASTELLGKLPAPERMISRYNCLAVRDVNNVEELADALIIATDAPRQAAAIGRRGQTVAADWARHEDFPSAIEKILRSAAGPRKPGKPRRVAQAPLRRRFPMIWFALDRLASDQRKALLGPLKEKPDGLAWAKAIAKRLQAFAESAGDSVSELINAVRLDLCLETVERNSARPESRAPTGDRYFRFRPKQFPTRPKDWSSLVPLRLPTIQFERFEYDLSEMMQARSSGQQLAPFAKHPTYLAVARCGGENSRVLVLHEGAGRLLACCDGSANVDEIARHASPLGRRRDLVRCLEMLLEHGLIEIRKA